MKIKLPKLRKPRYGEIVITWMVLTIGGLFGGQIWHESWSTANSFMSEMPETGQAMAELKAAQHAAMTTDCVLSIDEAMVRIASADRTSIPLLSPETSTDMGPAAGWMHHPDYVAPPVYDPAASDGVVPIPIDDPDAVIEGEGEEEATDAEEATGAEEAEETPTAPAVRAPEAPLRPAMAPPTTMAPAAPMVAPAPAMMNAPAPAPAPAAEE